MVIYPEGPLIHMGGGGPWKIPIVGNIGMSWVNRSNMQKAENTKGVEVRVLWEEIVAHYMQGR